MSISNFSTAVVSSIDGSSVFASFAIGASAADSACSNNPPVVAVLPATVDDSIATANDSAAVDSVVGSSTADVFAKLTDKENKLDKKLKRVRVYRKVFNFILIAALHLVAALVASVASAPLATVGTWLDKLWNMYRDEL
ncbi:hypothetical protein Droror1_Dr00016463 [Drosera rotundifolia]